MLLRAGEAHFRTPNRRQRSWKGPRPYCCKRPYVGVKWPYRSEWAHVGKWAQFSTLTRGAYRGKAQVYLLAVSTSLLSCRTDLSSFDRASYASTSLVVIVCLSVCMSDTSRSCTKTAKPRITLRTSYDSSGDLVFRRQKISAKFRRRHFQRGRQIEVG